MRREQPKVRRITHGSKHKRVKPSACLADCLSRVRHGYGDTEPRSEGAGLPIPTQVLFDSIILRFLGARDSAAIHPMNAVRHSKAQSPFSSTKTSRWC